MTNDPSACELAAKEYRHKMILTGPQDYLADQAFKAGWSECEKLMQSKISEPVMTITDGPFMVENITIDQRFKFEQKIKQLESKLEVALKILDDTTYSTDRRTAAIAKEGLAQLTKESK